MFQVILETIVGFFILNEKVLKILSTSACNILMHINV